MLYSYPHKMEKNRLKYPEVSNTSMKSSPSISPGSFHVATEEGSHHAPLDKDENSKPSAKVERVEWPTKFPILCLKRVNLKSSATSQLQTRGRHNAHRKKTPNKTTVGQDRDKKTDTDKKHYDDINSDSESDDPFKVLGNQRWSALDNLRLTANVQQTRNLNDVYFGVKFSCQFTLEEITEKWRSLLYDERSWREAQKDMIQLHPVIQKRILKKVIFNDKEEHLLMAINEVRVGNPDLQVFQNILEENSDVFFRTRTPESLLSHWQRLRLVKLLHCQKNQKPKDRFEEFEMDVKDEELKTEPVDEVRTRELQLAARRNMRRIRKLEKETGILEALLDNLVTEQKPGLVQTDRMATLRGERTEYAMNSHEFTFGRRTPFNYVDADLQLEGSADHVSRQHGKITIDKNGYFHLYNSGRNNLMVSGKTLRPFTGTLIEDQSVILIGALSFIFEVNKHFIEHLRQNS